jgi:antitoxin component of MazEF toxin-antitoxin module
VYRAGKRQTAVRTPNIIIQALDRTPDDKLTINIKNNGFSEAITTESGKNEHILCWKEKISIQF